VGRDGSVDWLPVPDLDSPSVFAAVLDAERGGRATLAPTVPYTATRRYLPDTNVLETTFTTATGVVRVTDAMTVPDTSLPPWRELQRRIEGLSGRVPMRWTVEPRFDHGRRTTRLSTRPGFAVARLGADALAVRSWDAGEVTCDRGGIAAGFETRPGSRGLVALCFSHQEPLVLPTRDECEARLDRTVAVWRRWLSSRTTDGPWSSAVARSALALKLLVFAPSGAVAAAATTSLPEWVGGERNWDYRFSWVRDSAFTLASLLHLGSVEEARAYFWWLMHATALTHPRLKVLYRLDGSVPGRERTLPLAGYRGSRPVRRGNAAVGQVQLDTYGELLQTAWVFASETGRLDRDIGVRLADMADLVCRVWHRPDSGIWEVRSRPRHFTQSKMMCWVALDRAIALAERGLLPGGRVASWRRQRREIRQFVESRCYSDRRRSYVRAAGSEEIDASLLLGVLYGFGAADHPRSRGTVEAVARELSDGPLVHRYRGEDGVSGAEGAFVACSFWLAEALARNGRVDRAAELMDRAVGLANDVGLYSEEIEPGTGAFLGNLPQALSHLALISAARAIGKRVGR
jgi:GH15 family glucan-1,4-alpha-glucosidase